MCPLLEYESLVMYSFMAAAEPDWRRIFQR